MARAPRSLEEMRAEADPELVASRQALDGVPISVVLNSGVLVEGHYCAVPTEDAKWTAELLRAISDRTTGCHVFRDVTLTIHGKTVHAEEIAIDPEDIQLVLGYPLGLGTEGDQPAVPHYGLTYRSPATKEGRAR